MKVTVQLTKENSKAFASPAHAFVAALKPSLAQGVEAGCVNEIIGYERCEGGSIERSKRTHAEVPIPAALNAIFSELDWMRMLPASITVEVPDWAAKRP